MASVAVWDVIVVGGGAAGLVTAYELKQAGLRALVLEGRERLGGRILTKREPLENGQHAEAGAEYFEIEQRRVNHYIDTFGLEREITRAPYDRTLFLDTLFSFEQPDKDKLPESIRKELTSHFFSFDLHIKYFHPLWLRLMSECGNDEDEVWERLMEISVLDVLQEAGASQEEISYIRMILAPDEGVELDAVPATQLDQEGWPDDYMKHMFRLKGGNDSLIQSFAGHLEGQVWTNCIVEVIEQDEDTVAVTFSRNGEMELVYASFAVLAVPAVPLRNISFLPALSDEKQHALEKLNFATVDKILIQFRERYWKEAGWNGNFASEHPLCVWNQTEHQDGETGVLCFYTAASMTLQLREMDEAAAQTFLLGVLQQQGLLPKDVEIVFFELFNWGVHPFSGGSWSVYPLGYEEEFIETLAEPQGRLYFAGEHLPSKMGDGDDDLIDTVESALSSGIRATRNILKRLKIPSSKWKALSSFGERMASVETRAETTAELSPESTKSIVDAVETDEFMAILEKEKKMAAKTSSAEKKESGVDDGGDKKVEKSSGMQSGIPVSDHSGEFSSTSSDKKTEETPEVSASVFEIIGPSK